MIHWCGAAQQGRGYADRSDVAQAEDGNTACSLQQLKCGGSVLSPTWCRACQDIPSSVDRSPRTISPLGSGGPTGTDACACGRGGR